LRDEGGWRCHPPLAFPAPRRPSAGVATSKASPPCVLVDSAPLNGSSHTRTTKEVRSATALARTFLCRRKVLRAAFTRSRCLSVRILQSGTQCPRVQYM